MFIHTYWGNLDYKSIILINLKMSDFLSGAPTLSQPLGGCPLKSVRSTRSRIFKRNNRLLQTRTTLCPIHQRRRQTNGQKRRRRPDRSSVLPSRQSAFSLPRVFACMGLAARSCTKIAKILYLRNRWRPHAAKGPYTLVKLSSNRETVFAHPRTFNARPNQIREGMEVRVFELEEPRKKGQSRVAGRVEIR